MMSKRCLALFLTVIMLLGIVQINTWAEDTITVSFTLMGDSCHGEEPHVAYEVWIDNETVECKNGATVYDVFTEILDNKGYTYIGAEDGYVYEVTTPEGIRLGAFDNGPYSGWMFEVNDINPDVGLKDYAVSKGDSIVWYYTDDYMYDWESSTETATEATTNTTTETTTEVTTEMTTERTTETATKGFNYGDADGDGVLTGNDPAYILQYSNNRSSIEVNEEWLKKADVDGDGTITANDAAYVYQKVLVGSTVFPVER